MPSHLEQIVADQEAALQTGVDRGTDFFTIPGIAKAMGMPKSIASNLESWYPWCAKKRESEFNKYTSERLGERKMYEKFFAETQNVKITDRGSLEAMDTKLEAAFQGEFGKVLPEAKRITLLRTCELEMAKLDPLPKLSKLFVEPPIGFGEAGMGGNGIKVKGWIDRQTGIMEAAFGNAKVPPRIQHRDPLPVVVNKEPGGSLVVDE